RAQLTTLWPALQEATVPPGYTGARRDDYLATRLTVTSAAKGNESGLRSQFTQPLVVVFSIAGLLLMIACVNLAGLCLGRGAARVHEIALVLALGAVRWRVARQMLTEGILLSLTGAGAGILLATWSCSALTGLIFEEYLIAVSFDATPDVRVIAITIV